jgi:hypothetical protein
MDVFNGVHRSEFCYELNAEGTRPNKSALSAVRTQANSMAQTIIAIVNAMNWRRIFWPRGHRVPRALSPVMRRLPARKDQLPPKGFQSEPRKGYEEKNEMLNNVSWTRPHDRTALLPRNRDLPALVLHPERMNEPFGYRLRQHPVAAVQPLRRKDMRSPAPARS